ncbi:hypothetical protein HDU67_003159 [Dinochytrium kinnereticum]|nr:hypothetical protein HDU67_003159 [Dinochytrium kinnereticum]
MMTALVMRGYGPKNMVLDHISRPSIASPHDILIQLKAASVNPGDVNLAKGNHTIVSSLTFPCTIGTDYSGIVHSVGSAVTLAKPGDKVFGKFGDSRHGAFAEFILINERRDFCCLKPAGVSFEEAAGVGTAALDAFVSLVDNGKLAMNGHGKTVLIIGATGGVGSCAVQIAKAYSASVICGIVETRDIELCNSIGATHVIDYTKENVAEALKAMGHKYDIVVDSVGGDDYWRAIEPFLIDGGVYASTAGPSGNGNGEPITVAFLAKIIWATTGRNLFSRTKYRMSLPSHSDTSRILPLIAGLMECGHLKTVVARTFPFAEAQEAFKILESNRSVGKVILVP